MIEQWTRENVRAVFATHPDERVAVPGEFCPLQWAGRTLGLGEVAVGYNMIRFHEVESERGTTDSRQMVPWERQFVLLADRTGWHKITGDVATQLIDQAVE